jgi:hypothetical protein
MRDKIWQWGRAARRAFPWTVAWLVSCHPQKSEPTNTPQFAAQRSRPDSEPDGLLEMGRRPTGKVVVEGRFPSLEVRLEHCDDRSLIPVNSIAFGREGQGPSDVSKR